MANPNFEDDFLKSLQSGNNESEKASDSDSQPAGQFFDFMNADTPPAASKPQKTPQEETPVEDNPFAFLGGGDAPVEEPVVEEPVAEEQPEETPAEDNPFAFLGGGEEPEPSAPAFDLFSTLSEPVEEELVEEEPVEEEPAEEEPAEEEPAEEEPAEEEPAEEEPVEEEPAEEEPVEEEPVEEEPVEEEPVEEEPVEEEPAEEEPAEEEPVEEEPAEEEPAEEEPVEEESAEEEPAEEEPVEEEPVEEEPVEEEPAEGDTFALAFGGATAEEPVEEAEVPKVEDRLVRCPKCGEEMLLSELVDVATGEPLDLVALVPAGLTAAKQEDSGYSLVGGGLGDTAFGGTSAPAAEGESVPHRKVIRRSRPKKPRSVFKELLFVVLGGVMAVPIAHYLAIPIQKYVQKREDAYGLFQFPTPGFPDTYQFQKKFPWVPTCLLPGFEADAVDGTDEEEEAPVQKENKKVEKSVDEATDAGAEEEQDWGEEETEDADKVEADVVNEEAASEEKEDGDFALTGDFTEPEESEAPASTDSGALSDMFGSRPGEEAAPKPAEEPKAEEPKAEEPKAEEPKAEEKPAEPAPAAVFSTEKLPEVKVEELLPLLSAFPTSVDDKTLASVNEIAMKLTCLKKDDASKAIFEQANAALKKLASDAAVVEKLNPLQAARIVAENHGQGIVFTGRVEKVAEVKGMTALKVAVDNTDKKVYLLHSEAGNAAEGKRYVFTGILVDPNQDEHAVITPKKVPLVWRGEFVEIP